MTGGSFRKTVKIFLMVASLFTGAVFPAWAEQWAFVADFSQLPEDNMPAWRRGGEGEALIENGRLHLRSGLQGGVAYILSGSEHDAVWDGTKPSTVAFRARVVDSVAGPVAGHVSIRTGDRLFVIPVSEREEAVYHFLFREAGDGRLFINGTEQGLIKARPLPDGRLTNGIMFGDLGGSTGGETEWSDFRWTNTGAFEP